MTTPDDLRSHAIGQQARELTDRQRHLLNAARETRMNDDVDPASRSVLEAMESAAKPTDREWARLRAVETAAKRLVLGGPHEWERNSWELREALWPGEQG